MPTVTCFCQKCGDRFYSKDELYAPPIRSLFKISSQKDIPHSWDDWLIHISTHCEKCRLQNPPTSCINDLSRIKGH